MAGSWGKVSGRVILAFSFLSRGLTITNMQNSLCRMQPVTRKGGSWQACRKRVWHSDIARAHRKGMAWKRRAWNMGARVNILVSGMAWSWSLLLIFSSQGNQQCYLVSHTYTNTSMDKRKLG